MYIQCPDVTYWHLYMAYEHEYIGGSRTGSAIQLALTDGQILAWQTIGQPEAPHYISQEYVYFCQAVYISLDWFMSQIVHKEFHMT